MKQEENKMYVDWPSYRFMPSWSVTLDANLFALLYILKTGKTRMLIAILLDSFKYKANQGNNDKASEEFLGFWRA